MTESGGMVRIASIFATTGMVPRTTYLSDANADVKSPHRLLQDSGDIYNA
jgi:hypothetical protein